MRIGHKVLVNTVVFAALALSMSARAVVLDHSSQLHMTPPRHFLSDR